MKYKFLVVCLAVVALSTPANAQGLVGKLKQKANEAASKALEKKVDEKIGIDDGQPSESTPSSSTNSGTSESRSRAQNKTGGGLVSTPPDVKSNLADADKSFKSKSYSQARYAIQQAMLGVEMEIGQKVLATMPASVKGLDRIAESDQVTSTGYGWAGLTIQREYAKGDQELRAMVANNSMMMAAVNMYLASGGYAQTTNGQQNWKHTKVKGHRGIIEYDDSSGYKLSVPLGQTSLLVWEGINFASEQEMMSAAEAFDIDGIMKMLGEK